MINYIEAGRRIKERRKELGLTQERIAEKINITPSFYSQIETGTRKAGINTFVSLSNELSISLDFILCNQPNNLLPENAENIDVQILHRMKDFTNVEKECVLELVNALNKVFALR